MPLLADNAGGSEAHGTTNVLVVGASGLIGSSICASLVTAGYSVTALARSKSASVPAGVVRIIRLDVASVSAPEEWFQHLSGIDAVVNCAGALQDSPTDDTAGVHAKGPAALFLACERRGVRRVIHFSALGVDKAQPTSFSRTKLEGDTALMSQDLDWIVLRPSVVLGRPVFGASALMRGLAALPIVPGMPSTGRLSVVQLQDVVSTVLFFLDLSAPSKVVLELSGPEQLTFDEVVAAYRRWFGWPPARRVPVPDFAASGLYRLGDAASLFGWRPPVRTTARLEIARGATGDSRQWVATTGIRPTSLQRALCAAPATVQDRWFARLYFLKPLIFVVLAVFWIATGAISLTMGFEAGVDLMLRTGAGPLSAPVVIAGAIADIGVGTAIAFRRLSRAGLFAAIAVSLFYAAAATVFLPELWNEPLGPIVKIFPILVLHLCALAVLEER